MRYITIWMKVMELEVYFLIYRKRLSCEGLVLKLKQNGISGNLLNILQDFLKNRKQRVVLNWQAYNWVNIHAGVRQGSILEPLLFLIYVNDLAENLSSKPKLFADDTSLFSLVRDRDTSAIDIMTT